MASDAEGGRGKGHKRTGGMKKSTIKPRHDVEQPMTAQRGEDSTILGSSPSRSFSQESAHSPRGEAEAAHHEVSSQASEGSNLDTTEHKPAVPQIAHEPSLVTKDATPEMRNDNIPAPSLIAMLKNKSEKIRLEVLESLLKIADKSLSYAFVSCMKDESYRIRLGALRGLYKFAGEFAVEYLISALNDQHPDVRRRAVIYLGWLRKKELVPYLVSALADSSPLVKKVATYALGDLKDDSAVPHLIKSLDDRDLEVKKGALAALRRITKQSIDAPSGASVIPSSETIEKWKQWWETQHT